jgi:hypothetical protein
MAQAVRYEVSQSNFVFVNSLPLNKYHLTLLRKALLLLVQAAMAAKYYATSLYLESVVARGRYILLTKQT